MPEDLKTISDQEQNGRLTANDTQENATDRDEETEDPGEIQKAQA